ncbi:hypothetical protein [Liquorilactobacillus cacaonum]|uniref:Uncharacterized protein n=1 Tax=Liquorilactobacillus cacaonum DSM 21116 TaxID=1423729 RepID=A0A0R2CNZ1_9LACO|nr:hypothetical protein [Liquorilactobacillus cacaonum]KRM89926.1 hypothetical protein FC80_GL001748 [Liquorilactobacillus cacaonum DSM 21116]
MDIKVKDFISRVESSDITKVVLGEIKIKEFKDLKKDFMEAALLEYEKTSLKRQVVQVTQPIMIEKEKVEMVLETGVINLPFSNINRVDNFLNIEETVPMVSNLITISPNLNISGLFIRSYSSVDNLQDDIKKISEDAFTDIMKIQENVGKTPS